MSDADWCCSTQDQNGLWYNDRWSEADWIAAHLLIARRYEGSPYVVAGELRNELRSSVVGGTRLTPQWPSTDGPNDNRTDWPAAALRASSAILEARPTGYLIVVDGLSFSTDCVYRAAPPVLVAAPDITDPHARSYGRLQQAPGPSSAQQAGVQCPRLQLEPEERVKGGTGHTAWQQVGLPPETGSGFHCARVGERVRNSPRWQSDRRRQVVGLVRGLPTRRRHGFWLLAG